MAYVGGLSTGPLLRLSPTLALVIIALIVLTQIVMLAKGRVAIDSLLFAAVFLVGVYQQNRIEEQNQVARERVSQLEKQTTVRVEGRLAATDRTYPTRLTYRLKDCVVRGNDGSVVEFPTAIQLACSGEAFEKARNESPMSGDRVIAEGRLRRPPDLSNPDVFNYRAHLERNGIGASVLVRRAEEVTFLPPTSSRSLRDWAVGSAEQLRRWVEAALDRALEPEVAALNRSIFLGEAEWLDRDVRRDFTRCGLAHIFAVSGLNVAFLVWVLDTFIRLLRPTPAGRSAILIAVAAIFCAVVGFQASVARATIMITVLLALPLLHYKIEPLTALATAALLILGFNPRALWQAGFQLSFVCMLSIIVLMPLLEAWLYLDEGKGPARRKRTAIWVNRHLLYGVTMLVSAQVGLLPLLAHYYYMIPCIGVLSNVLALPLVWLIMAATLVLLVMAALAPATMWIVGNVLNLSVYLLLGLVRWWSNLPAVTIATPDWPVWVGAAFYIILFGWAVLPGQPSPFFEAKQRARLWIALATVAAWVVWAPAVLRGSGNDLRATFLDVGQGDSCVVELPAGPVVLVDAGDEFVRAGERIVVPFLEARGIERLDAVIATHPDSDHIGGLPAVFRDLDVAWLIEGPGQSNSQAYKRLSEAVQTEFARHDVVFAGDWIEAPMGVQLLFLHPQREAAYSNTNDQSLVVMLDWRSCQILILGDVERAGERDLVASGADLGCEILKVAHHGSARATSQAFLDRARPRLAVISCGRDNPYGHPSPEVLDRLTSAAVTIARTDRDGAVTVRCDGRSFEWRTEGKSE